MDRITTTIKRIWLDQIVARTKDIEYREIKPYWTEKFIREGTFRACPFELRMINGMAKKAPEVIVRIDAITVGTEYQLHIGKILEVRNWPVRKRRNNGKDQTRKRHRRPTGR